MSFFDNRVRLGTAIWAIGILQCVSGLTQILWGIADVLPVSEGIPTGIAHILSGIISIALGNGIRLGVFKTKWDILLKILLMTAVNTALDVTFGIREGLVDTVATDIMDLALAGIMVLVYRKLKKEQPDRITKVLFYITCIVYVCMLISDMVSITDSPVDSLRGICGLIVDIYVILALRDPAIREKFGIVSKKTVENAA